MSEMSELDIISINGTTYLYPKDKLYLLHDKLYKVETMNEIPKLRVIRPSNKSTTRFEGFLYESNLKEVNTFYDKYKDNMGLFIKDFPEFKIYWEHREKSLSLCCIQEYLYVELFKGFKDWLHDLLYKVE